jgi:cysteine desulfurase
MLEKVAIYLDSNAGAPLKPSVLEALLPYLRGDCVLIPNPSSIHGHGRLGKRTIAEAKEKIAASLGIQGNRSDLSSIHFTSSGSEANQIAIRSVLEPLLTSKPHWITTRAEHDSNRQMIAWFEARGGSVDYLPLDSAGSPQVEMLRQLIQPETALISAIWINNETGVITDIARLVQIASASQIPVHLDAAQAWGKVPVDLSTLGADWVTFSGHKIGAFAGIGLLWTSQGKKILPTVLGKQDLGRRGGTENLIGILGLGAAAAAIEPLAWAERVQPLRDKLEAEIIKRIPGVLVNGGSALRVANTLNLSFEGMESEGLVIALDLDGYSVSAGSACSSGVLEPSLVLLAMGRTVAQAKASIRVSLSDVLPWETLEGFCRSLEKIVTRLRRIHSARTLEKTKEVSAVL